MRNIKVAFWAVAVAPVLLFLLVDPSILQPAGFLPFRHGMLQLTGILAISFMSVALLLALRPRFAESLLGGLDKMYRLHKWLGIAALVLSILHWMLAQAPGWAISLGWLQRGARSPRAPVTDPIKAFLSSQHSFAESIGEWAFYAIVVLIVLALLRYFPYRLFYKTHRLIAIAYLVLVIHAAVLMTYEHWMTPLGVVVALILIGGSIAAVLALADRIGAGRRVTGRIVDIHRFPGVRSLATRIELGDGWPGHKPGQFAFAMSDPAEGPHPYTIASAWDASKPQITLIAKELGDHTGRLRDKLRIGQPVRLEGPYGRFTFDNGVGRQIWIAGGIGVTPFIAQMEQLARMPVRPDRQPVQIDLFHSTAEIDDEALARLAASAKAAHIRLHLLIHSRDGRLSGDRIREIVPDWRKASLWFCGPVGFGEALRRDFAAHGFPVERQFHQELFAMR